MTQNPVEAKRLLRTEILRLRKNQPNPPEAFASRVLELARNLGAKSIGCYVSFGSEPSTKLLIAQAKDNGLEVYCPRANSLAQLEFVECSDELEMTTLGFEAPTGISHDAPLDVLVIPALAIDQSGNRLGRGGGYFDKYLEHYKGQVVALVFDNELVNLLPSEPHDQLVDYAITPTRTLSFSTR